MTNGERQSGASADQRRSVSAVDPIWRALPQYRLHRRCQIHPMPGFLVLKTQHRTAILVHPGHPPNLYLVEHRLLQPDKAIVGGRTDGLHGSSRARVIALLDSLKKHDPGAFDHQSNTPITNAALVISGEPMTPVSGIPVRVADQREVVVARKVAFSAGSFISRPPRRHPWRHAAVSLNQGVVRWAPVTSSRQRYAKRWARGPPVPSVVKVWSPPSSMAASNPPYPSISPTATCISKFTAAASSPPSR